METNVCRHQRVMCPLRHKEQVGRVREMRTVRG